VPLKALVIGGGSIGKRHAEILNQMDECGEISMLTTQDGLSYHTISSMEHVLGLNPDYIVIASPTDKHYLQLKYLENHLIGKKILVEKPLFDSGIELTIKNNEVYVGYNLRFHPVLQKIKEMLNGRELWNIHIFCGSYLPDWRPGVDYRQSSSASTKTGGGVLLDLSHELDYIQWLSGSLEVEYSVNKKVSDLNIDTDDILLLSGHTSLGANFHLSLNYFTRKPLRQIIIDGNGISIQGDLNSNTLHIVRDNKVLDFSWTELKRNDTYQAQHKSIFQSDSSLICTFKEGLETMRLIDHIRFFKN